MAVTPDICEFGWSAIDARLPGTDGELHSIHEHAGPNGLVVVFICNHCPYVKAIVDRLVRDARDLEAHGVGFVAICSNDATSHPDDSFDNMVAFAERHGMAFPYLHDEDQSVAKAYDAVCTPDFFGFNNKMELQYRGRLDASRASPAAGDVRRDLYEAMAQIAATGEGPRDQIASMGCSIKWREAV